MRKLIFLASCLWTVVNSQSCVTPLGRTSECVSLYDCPQLLTAFENRPIETSVARYLKESHCGFSGYIPRVCCGPLPSNTPNRPQPVTPESPPVLNDHSGYIDPVNSADSNPAPRTNCGVETNGDRIYGGNLTDIDEFPWMALLGYRTPSGSITYQCGGTLINNRYVLTAAHCITGAIEVQVGKLETVRLGEYDTQTPIDCKDGVCADPPQEIPVHLAVPHSGYKDTNRNRKDDVGLVRLAQRARYNYYVKPICLVNANERIDVGNDVYVAGWGKTLSGKNSPLKLKLRMPMFSKEECAAKYRNLGAVLTDKQICAGGIFSQDTCRGDSGGPLMRLRPEGIWETAGVVSFGHGCGADGWPGVYSSVASYLDWILSTMRSTNV